MPPRHTAVGLLARALERLESHPFPPRLTGAPEKLFLALAPERIGTGSITVVQNWRTSLTKKR